MTEILATRTRKMTKILAILTFHQNSRNRRVASVLIPTEKKESFPSCKSRGVPIFIGLTLKEEDFNKYAGLHVAIKFGEPCEVIVSGTDHKSAREEANNKGFKNLPILFVQPGVFKKAQTN